MITAHEKQFGKKPLSLTMSFPRLFIHGVQVNFMKEPYNFSNDGEACLHHHFPNHEPYVPNKTVLKDK